MENQQCDGCGNVLSIDECDRHANQHGVYCSHNCMKLSTEEIAVTVERTDPQMWFGFGIFGEGALG